MSAGPKIAVVGATGYAGRELAHLLVRHPSIGRPVFFLREGRDGERRANCITDLYPELRGRGEAPCRAFSVDAVAASGAEAAFLALPHEISAEVAPPLIDAGLKVIDLSGAFRFRDSETYAEWYRLPPAPAALLGEAVYGLPEVYGSELTQARVVANPGCYPTAVILGLKPLVDAGWIDRGRGIVCDAKSGVSGAGKQPKPETHFVEVNENFRAYGLFTHRHTPEITGHLDLAPSDVIFTTHLLPIERGILATLYVGSTGNAKRPRSRRSTARFTPGGRWCGSGRRARFRRCGTWRIRISATSVLCSTGTRGVLVVVSCLDNLGKGAAGQAVQNMNAMFGIEETEGLL